MRYLRIFLILLGSWTLAAAIVQKHTSIEASSPGSQLPSGISNQTYQITVDLINVLCSVFDRNTNSFITTLTRDDFRVFEDGREQEIVNFIRETDLPLTIAVLVDVSAGMAPKLKFVQETANSFFHSVLRRQDRAMLVAFDTSTTLLQDFTSDPNKLVRQVGNLRSAGERALYDAIYRVCDEKMIRETGRKAFVIISDGNDNSSTASLDQAIEMALRAESIIFSISTTRGGFFGVGEQSRQGESILRRLAEETGGKIFYPFKVEDLADSFHQISQELRSQYNIGYISTNTAHDGSYREIDIRVQGRNLEVNHRKGYYAPSN
ncbi:MAG TPA: VWA domain-containing protein [Acidobacteriota bacterium]|nr:VWA domain-containing protein [Acidobacteriota bacterium]